MGKKSKVKKRPDPSERLNNHLKILGLASADEYQSWCSRNGFGTALNKPKKMLTRERRFKQEKSRRASEQVRDAEHVPARHLLLALATGQTKARSTRHAHLRRFANLISAHLAPAHNQSLYLPDLVNLVEYLTSIRSKLVDPSSNRASLTNNGISLAETLVLVASHRGHWVRPLEEWKPRTKNPRRQLRSLIRHLLDKYGEVPQFMDQAWAIGLEDYNTIDPTGLEHRDWYLWLGEGRNLRERDDLPISVTKRIAHEFMRAPADVTIPQALRWAQVISLGGDKRLAQAIIGTRLGLHFTNEDFWSTVVKWFIEQPMLDTVHFGPIVDYLMHQRFVGQRVYGGAAGQDTWQPAEPNLTMKGRRADTLLRQVETWHRCLAKDNRFQQASWQPTGIGGFSCAEGREDADNFRVWTIRELLSSRALMIEGQKMRHCVASYSRSCESRATSIWTLEVESRSGVDKRITLEVRPQNNTVVQARGKSNRLMTEQERNIVGRWCRQAGLSMSLHI